jgi:acyl carrier protein
MMNIREKIINVLEAAGIYFDREKNDDDSDLREYIMDSIQFITFIVELEKEINIEFPDDVLIYDKLASLNGFITIVGSIIDGSYVGSADDNEVDKDNTI